MILIKRNYFVHRNIKFSYLDCLSSKFEVKDTILLLHGFTASAYSNWVAPGWVDKLIAKGFRVIVPDACGHGKSEKVYNSSVYSSSEMIKDSLALLNQLKIEHVHVMGYSMGARMAAFGAINQPNVFKKIILGGMGFNLHKGVGGAQIIADALTAKDLKQIKNRHGKIFRRLAEREGNDLQALAYCILSNRQQISKKSLSQIESPTLICVGEKDSISGDADQLAKLLPNALAITVSECNHFDALMKSSFQSKCLDFLFKG